jgi:hypothetical protein
MRNTRTQSIVFGTLLAFLASWHTELPSDAAEPVEGLGAQARIAEEYKPLQGRWEGDGAGGKCSITIVGNSLEYHNSAGWYKTTFTLPANTDPRQLHATIKEVSPPSKSAIGRVVLAIYKIENDSLTLAELDDSDQIPKSFDEASSQYKVKRVKSQNDDLQKSPEHGRHVGLRHSREFHIPALDDDNRSSRGDCLLLNDICVRTGVASRNT